jgi:hypothetical protein
MKKPKICNIEKLNPEHKVYDRLPDYWDKLNSDEKFNFSEKYLTDTINKRLEL